MFHTQWVGYMTIVKKETNRIVRIWPQTLLPSVITTTLYFLVFGSFIGNRIGTIGEVSYVQFIVPGLIMMSIITNAYSNVVTVVFGAKFQKSIEELLISPLSTTTIIAGWVTSGVVRGGLVGFLVFLVSRWFAPFQVENPLIVVVTLLLTAIFFSLLGIANGLYAKNFDQVSIVTTFILTPLIYLGGVFYSITSLPVFWQNVSRFNPILYLINTFRYGFLGITDIPVETSLMILAGLTIGFAFAVHYFISRGYGLRS